MTNKVVIWYIEGDKNSCHFLIIAFSVLNAQVLFTKEKAVNKSLDILAKCEGILFCVWAFATVFHLLLF